MQENQQQPGPSTNDEWNIHVLNIHGTFFERCCQEVVRQAPQWDIIDTNHPVEYRGQASNLDIWATRNVYKHGETRRLTLPIECKKNNPGFVDWIFFPQPSHRTVDPWIHTLLPYYLRVADRFTFRRELWNLTHDLTIADEARETKGDYLRHQRQEKTKTSNDAIMKAASQIALATQALVIQESKLLQALIDAPATPQKPYDAQFFFPTIVTTANLFICHYRDTDIDLSTGEILFDKAQLTSCPYMLFNYALPPTLQLTPVEAGLNTVHRKTFIQLARCPIFIVQSAAFPAFLEKLSNNLLKEGPQELEVVLQPTG